MADLRESDSVAAANGLLAHGWSEDELKAEGEIPFIFMSLRWANA